MERALVMRKFNRQDHSNFMFRFVLFFKILPVYNTLKCIKIAIFTCELHNFNTYL